MLESLTEETLKPYHSKLETIQDYAAMDEFGEQLAIQKASSLIMIAINDERLTCEDHIKQLFSLFEKNKTLSDIFYRAFSSPSSFTLLNYSLLLKKEYFSKYLLTSKYANELVKKSNNAVLTLICLSKNDEIFFNYFDCLTHQSLQAQVNIACQELLKNGNFVRLAEFLIDTENILIRNFQIDQDEHYCTLLL